jgi:hypothetical protein
MLFSVAYHKSYMKCPSSVTPSLLKSTTLLEEVKTNALNLVRCMFAVSGVLSSHFEGCFGGHSVYEEIQNNY